MREEITARLGDPEGPWVLFKLVPKPQALAATVVRIGRGPENDLVLDDLLVSREHAELRCDEAGQCTLIDLGSYNGTFVNGQQIETATVVEYDLISIGHAEFRLVGSGLEAMKDDPAVAFAAVGLTAIARAGTTLVESVSFPLGVGSMCAVVGPSGSGKSSLLDALTGLRPAAAGTVLIGGRDLYAAPECLKARLRTPQPGRSNPLSLTSSPSSMRLVQPVWRCSPASSSRRGRSPSL